MSTKPSLVVDRIYPNFAPLTNAEPRHTSCFDVGIRRHQILII